MSQFTITDQYGDFEHTLDAFDAKEAAKLWASWTHCARDNPAEEIALVRCERFGEVTRWEVFAQQVIEFHAEARASVFSPDEGGA